MPTRNNVTTIGVDRMVKFKLSQYLQGNTWDDLLYTCIKLIEKEISQPDPTGQP